VRAYNLNDSISPWNGQSSDFFTNPPTDWILSNVFPFLTVAFAQAQNVIEKFLLPERSALFHAGTTTPDFIDVAPNLFTGPLLPLLHEHSQWFSA